MYNGWLLDVPRLMDLAVLYGGTNRGLVGQLVDLLFQLQVCALG